MIFSVFQHLMNDRMLDLPRIWDGINFIKTLREHYDYYLIKVKPLINYQDFKKLNLICDKLLSILESYYEGQPSNAFYKFKKLMETYNSYIALYTKSGLVNIFKNNDPLKLFRIRIVHDYKTYTRNDIFHTPYSLRRKVPSCRYSIAGYPSLYLSTRLHLCDEETRISELNDFKIASRFELVRDYSDNNHTDIKVIEMAIKPSDFAHINDIAVIEKNKTFNDINLSAEFLCHNYLFWYPLILSCSFIRNNKKDNFASEYIIPQLLMQWIRTQYSDHALYGIRYFSCSSIRASNMGFNYVFPVSGKNEISLDFCPILSTSFKMTNPRYINDYYSIDECEDDLIHDENVDYIIH